MKRNFQVKTLLLRKKILGPPWLGYYRFLYIFSYTPVHLVESVENYALCMRRVFNAAVT